ncbi:MAG: hypothetical protein NZT61_02595 [Deltaproteobacteria bacterium]|nr:hypothetical protein [Deltaproteobacteria bacterium]MCX7952280.1 hypothetical protein [Deltaproteobacteria bacterium]
MTYSYLLFLVVVNVIGGVIGKLVTLNAFSPTQLFFTINWYLFGILALFPLSWFLFLKSLQHFPLYLVVTVSTIGTVVTGSVVGILIFKESVSVGKIIGIVLALTGGILILKS